jgi:hypothetical protein
MLKETLTMVVLIAGICGALKLCATVAPACEPTYMGDRSHWDGVHFSSTPITRCLTPGKHIK